MKAVIKKRLAVIGIVGAAGLTWFLGVALEFEFPYFATIYRASRSQTATGERAADVIARTLGVPRSKLKWHRCSFCKNFEGTLPPGTVRIQVSIQPENNFIFAFDAHRGVIYPGDELTQRRFTSMPAAPGRSSAGSL